MHFPPSALLQLHVRIACMHLKPCHEWKSTVIVIASGADLLYKFLGSVSTSSAIHLISIRSRINVLDLNHISEDLSMNEIR
jgi:hypothetical protein